MCSCQKKLLKDVLNLLFAHKKNIFSILTWLKTVKQNSSGFGVAIVLCHNENGIHILKK